MKRQFKSINITYNLKKSLRPTRYKVTFVILLILGFTIPLVALNYSTKKFSEDNIYQQSEFVSIPDTRVGIVFGSSLNHDGTEPDNILKDRLDSAVELYKLGKIQKILVSGYKGTDYDEPQTMRKYLIEEDIPEFDITQDAGGENTYSSCFRAKEVFGLSKAVLITQEFHLPRAMYLCENFGVDSYGASADKSIYDNLFYNKFREVFALARAYYEINASPPPSDVSEKVAI